MKKKLLFPCVLLVLAMVLCGALSFGASAEETITMTEAYQETKVPASGDIVTISNESELDMFSEYVAKGKTTAGITFRLEADIALSDHGSGVSTMNPVGGKLDGRAWASVPFSGVFDGNGKTVSNYVMTDKYIDINGASKNVRDGVGRSFFGALSGATVKNLTLSVKTVDKVGVGAYGMIASTAVDSTITGCSVVAEGTNVLTLSVNASRPTTYFGGIVGEATGTTVVENCVVTLSIKGGKVIAGVVGLADGATIRNCISGGSFENTIANEYVAGIAGQLKNGASVKNCFTNASLNGYGSIAGVVAEVGAGCAVENCASAATILVAIGNANMTAGGLVVAKNAGTVTNAFGLCEAGVTTQKPHNAVGVNEGEGTATEVYAYTVTAGATEGKYVFTVGAVKTNVAEGGSATTYEFVAAEGNITLADALNKWVRENTTADVTYQEWLEIGNTVTNCFHTTLTIVPYDGKAPTCVESGLGYYVCSVCGKVMEDMDDVEMPATGIHTAPEGTASCEDYNCTVCDAFVEKSTDHIFDPNQKACEDRMCSNCNKVIEEVKVPHTKPADYDEEKSCKSYECQECHAVIAGATAHSFGSDIKACQEATCSVCGETVAATAAHRAGPAASCSRAQVCIVCRTEIKPKLEHISDGIVNCGKAEQCVLCNQKLGEPVGEHVPNKDHATCNGGVICLVCNSELEAQLTHKPNTALPVDCGHGQLCEHCNVVLEQASGAHTPDWSTATVVREATADRTGIVVAKCSTCGKDVERYTTLSAYDADGKLGISGSAALVVGSRVDIAFGKVSDYATLTIADGFVPLQVATFKLLGIGGEEIALSGNASVKMILNVSVAKMAKEHLKLYKVDGTTVTEVTISDLADGYITFSASATGTYLIAGTKTVAFEVIGSYIPEATPGETAALIGTPEYEKKDDEI